MMDFITVELVFVALAYVVGTLFGRHTARYYNVTDIVESTIDSLINDGYIKTEGHGTNMEIIKWQDWCNNED
jgi:hypothetical protein